MISVIVVSFNYGRYVAAAVDSVLAQTYGNLEIIVVEGGSTDLESRKIVAAFERPRTRTLMQEEPNRAGANRNFGISRARGRYVCCLDADDTLAPTYLEKAVFLLERHGYDVVSSAMQMVGEETGMLPILERPDLAVLVEGNHVLTSAVFRRAYWLASGGFKDVDRAIWGHVHEDWAFWTRLAALGARFYNLHHDPMLRYKVHHGSLSRSVDVAPMWRQRQLVRQMNEDVLQPLDESVAYSRKRANLRRGTPPFPPTALELAPASSEPHRPTVLLALPYMVMGGAERLLAIVVGHLVQTGWRVVIVTSLTTAAHQGDTSHWFEAHTAETFHLANGMPNAVWEEFLHHLVRSRRVDLLWIVGSALAYDSLRSLRAAHPALRVVDLLFNTVGHTANNRRRRFLIDLNLVENAEVGDWLLDQGETAERVCMVKSGVDTERFAPLPRCQTLSDRIGAGPDELIIGFSGRWSAEKNPLAFVEIARLVDHGLPLRFVMTGTGPMREALQAAIVKAGLPAQRFHLLGEVEEIVPVLASFDLLVLPSTFDGRPMVVLEALALGVPVLASRVGALPELIVEGQTGWLCAAGDDVAFARRIEAAARDRAGLQAMRRRAREFAQTQLEVKAMLDAYENGLRSVLPREQCDPRATA
ncbi:glycosyltransferase [Bosea sp. PAMC 26642]|uniref:glycosyltransferase n=1 Tax=Bosea sp. (strain PAMC 26642) TaxID=1792307 RepID=UPI00076FF7E5|nr:glycosyltransferase [Bosea sp. PAMC 26642]AMJ62700.1 hypothetical protein AXW83_22515 [Bosea sp. PAMC 26642]